MADSQKLNLVRASLIAKRKDLSRAVDLSASLVAHNNLQRVFNIYLPTFSNMDLFFETFRFTNNPWRSLAYRETPTHT